MAKLSKTLAGDLLGLRELIKEEGDRSAKDRDAMRREVAAIEAKVWPRPRFYLFGSASPC